MGGWVGLEERRSMARGFLEGFSGKAFYLVSRLFRNSFISLCTAFFCR